MNKKRIGVKFPTPFLPLGNWVLFSSKEKRTWKFDTWEGEVLYYLEPIGQGQYTCKYKKITNQEINFLKKKSKIDACVKNNVQCKKKWKPLSTCTNQYVKESIIKEWEI
jgi:hypothetical protein